MNYPIKTFITGGAGFIGRALVTELKHQYPDMEITIYDNFHPQIHKHHQYDELNQCRVVIGDICDYNHLKQIMVDVKPDNIFHLACETGTGQSFDELIRYTKTNISGTANLLDIIKNSLPGLKRLILSSSRAIYGEGVYSNANGKNYYYKKRSNELMSNKIYDLYEDDQKLSFVKSHSSHPPSPDSIYATTKITQEYMCENLMRNHNGNFTVFRFQNVYGPGQSLFNPYTGVLMHFCNLAFRNKDIEIYEDGEISRDFIFVDDVVSALVKSMQIRDKITKYDIGSGRATYIIDIARLIVDILNSKSKINITHFFRPGDIRHACADISDATNELGWSPKISLERGLKILCASVKEDLIKKGL